MINKNEINCFLLIGIWIHIYECVSKGTSVNNESRRDLHYAKDRFRAVSQAAAG